MNIRTKGQTGEREVIKILTTIYNNIYYKKYNKYPDVVAFQRNQNQSAVGGSDITNPFDLDIEVKRQEKLNIPGWWRQVTTVAKKSKGVPILIFRQSRKKWRVILNGRIPISNNSYMSCPVEISCDDFKLWIAQYMEDKIIR